MTLLDLDPEALAWLKTQPLAALESPGLRRGPIRRLRQAGFADLAGLATAERAAIAGLRYVADAGADLIRDRILQILAETPLRQSRTCKRPPQQAA